MEELGTYQIVLRGLPGYPKTAAALEGRDVETGAMWRAPIFANPASPTDSLSIEVPLSVPFTRVVGGDEYVEEWLSSCKEEVSSA